MFGNCTKILTQKTTNETFYRTQIYKAIFLYTTKNTPSVQRFSKHRIYISTPLFSYFLYFLFYATTSYHQPRMHNMLLLLLLPIFWSSFLLYIFQAIAIQWMATKRTVVGKKKFLHFLIEFKIPPHTHTHQKR